MTLAVAEGRKRLVESETTWLYFLTQFSTDEISCGVEAVQLEDYDTTFEWGLVNQGKLLIALKKILALAWIQIFINWCGSNFAWW